MNICIDLGLLAVIVCMSIGGGPVLYLNIRDLWRSKHPT